MREDGGGGRQEMGEGGGEGEGRDALGRDDTFPDSPL